jgi:hypothetical protein
MAHTNDIGLAIVDGLHELELVGRWERPTFDWTKEDPEETGNKIILSVDASYSFSDLIIESSDNCKFRVSVTRIG